MSDALDKVMFSAAAGGCNEEIHSLWAQGANFNATNEYGHTPVFWVAIDCRVENLRVLHELGERRAQAQQ